MLPGSEARFQRYVIGVHARLEQSRGEAEVRSGWVNSEFLVAFWE